VVAAETAVDDSGRASLSDCADANPHHTGAASAAKSQDRLQTEPDMIRHRSIHEPLEEQDRSMRIVEYAMAIAAFVVAGILAFVR
jgi:hypothetical protein